jgi:UDP-N-acetylmuramoyl-tripeptide--D-alanyl-D-alanine ligase
MKLIFKPILKYYLKFIAKLVLLIHRPIVIAVSGSINKYFFREEIKRVLEKNGFRVGPNKRSFNTEIGLPLAILNLGSGYNSYRGWIPVMKQAFLSIFKKDFSDVLVLELGVSAPGDMKYLLSIVKPKIAIITDITQRHLESFSDMDNLSSEYELLARENTKGGLAILNYDNIRLRGIVKENKGNVETFGFSGGSNWQAKETVKKTSGQKFKIVHGEKITENEIDRFGQHHILAFLAGKIIEDNLRIIKK